MVFEMCKRRLHLYCVYVHCICMCVCVSLWQTWLHIVGLSCSMTIGSTPALGCVVETRAGVPCVSLAN